MINLSELGIETYQRWGEKSFIEHGKLPYSEESTYLKSLADMTEWVPYEKYMHAKLIAATPGRVGLLHVKFPPEFAEDNRLHTHLYSDRLITVIEGSGQFLLAPVGEPIQNIPVKVGDRVWMPRGVRHTWYSGKNGLVVESIHGPFFAFEDPDILVYDQDLGYIDFLPDGSYIERKMHGSTKAYGHILAQEKLAKSSGTFQNFSEKVKSA